MWSASGLPPAGINGSEYVNADQFLVDPCPCPMTDVWDWQILPNGLIWHPYMAGVHESRLSGVVFGDQHDQALFDVTLGGRIGVLRYGTNNDEWPDGWQVDLEGAAFPRLNLDSNWDLDLTDFRFGVPLTYGDGPWRYKFAYYHLSSHLGDEFAIRNPGSLASRINYSRDALVLGMSYFTTPAVRLYGEADWAFHFDDGNRPWEFQFGVDIARSGRTGIYGTPFFAVNGHIREAVDFGGNLVVQAGWLWRGDSGRTARMGFHYYNGKSNQFEIFDQFEEQVGFGIWLDQ